MRKLFTSESVTEGHPDKLCDQVSDAVLDAILAQDPNAHVACECAAKTGFLMIFGEASGNFDVDYEAIARIIRKIGSLGDFPSRDQFSIFTSTLRCTTSDHPFGNVDVLIALNRTSGNLRCRTTFAEVKIY